jgi:hypothetical protein
MENSNQPKPQETDNRDAETWEIAKRRVSFKNHLATYLAVNAFLWGLWYFTGAGKGYWPIWTTGGWGIGLFFHFLGAYVFPRESSVEREYEKMMRSKR